MRTEALVTASLVFAAYDSPTLEASLLQDPLRVASDLKMSPEITISVADALNQNDVEGPNFIWTKE